MVELLAPAGNEEALYGAINAGADAIYLGGPKFGARAYADNFTTESLVKGIQTAHVMGKKVYLTVNVLTREQELPELVSMVKTFYEAGLDGVIVQDLGVIRALGKECPGLPLHASTQISVSSAESANLLRQLGVCRVVPARELSLSEIKQLKEESGMEIESFIHGAMCYSYSGRCLMSSFLGGRSGNRGRCAGTCRLPYAIYDPNQNLIPVAENGKKPGTAKGNVYPISMKDMCVLDILPELIDAGIDSFKIEGRMKKPEYAAGTTAFYRKYIDRFYEWDAKGRPGKWKIDDKDRAELLSLYIRADLYEGYYHTRNSKEMLTIHEPGYEGADDKLLSAIRQKYLSDHPRKILHASAEVYVGKPITMTVWDDDGNFISVQGIEAQAAQKSPLTKESIKTRLSKTGETNFLFDEIEVLTDDNSFVPVGALNELRRAAIDCFSEKLLKAYDPYADQPFIQENFTEKNDEKQLSLGAGQDLIALVLSKEQFEAAREKADIVIADGAALEALFRVLNESQEEAAEDTGEDLLTPKKTTYLAAFPAVFRRSDRAFADRFYERFCHKADGFYVRTLEEIEFLRKKGYDGRVIAGPSLYHWNQSSREFLRSYLDRLTLPLELSGREMEETFHRELSTEILTVYGRLPLMTAANCVKKTSGRCDHIENGFYYLEDRKGVRFPVRTDCAHCLNTIYNSVPLSLHTCYKERVFQKVGGILCSFTTENGFETTTILKEYDRLRFGERSAEASEKIAQFLRDGKNAGFTGGHFRKGAI